MDIANQLKESKAKRQEILDRFNALGDQLNDINQERSKLLQEVLRYDGEVRVMEKLSKNGAKEE